MGLISIIEKLAIPINAIALQEEKRVAFILLVTSFVELTFLYALQKAMAVSLYYYVLFSTQATSNGTTFGSGRGKFLS